MVETLKPLHRHLWTPWTAPQQKIPVRIEHFSATIEHISHITIFGVVQWAEARALYLGIPNTLSARDGLALLINPRARD